MSKELPEAKYTKFGEKIRHVIPGPMQCSMACGGRNCKWENPSKWSDEDQVIKGVFSSWVLENVVAMSRPSTEVIQKYDLIKQFKESNICSIINLQRPGEHASCGPPLHKESQFTYDPQVFMDNDIFFYNFGWKDYGVTSLETILDMVKVMAFALSEGKVAVHCHAGLGRSGVLIACYLVYAHRMDASLAINTVRKHRPNSIQTRGQIACIQEFAQFLKPLRIIFPQVVPHAERLTLERFLHRQRHLLHGFECRELKHIPKIVNIVCQRLVEIATASQDIGLFDTKMRLNASTKIRSAKKKRTLRRSNTVETLKETVPGAFVNEHLDSKNEAEDPLDSQEMNALISPRFLRKSESAKSRSTSKSGSQSRPESPVTTHIYASNPPSPTKLMAVTPSGQSNEPILVAPPQPVFAESSLAENVSEKTPGKPQVVLVKQGSRSGLLSSVTSITQSQPNIDNNLNNNNQMLPSMTFDTSTVKSSESKENDMKTPEKLHSPPENTDKTHKVSNLTSQADLPSPTPSIREPQISPRGQRGKPQDNATQNAAGDKPPIQIRRASAGKPQRVVPTGNPARGRIGSSKGISLSLLAGDSNITPEAEYSSNESTEVIGIAGDDEKGKENPEFENNEGEKSVMDIPSIDEQADDAETKVDMLPDGDLLDPDLEEIIDDGRPFLSESESEKEDGKSDKDTFPKSAASKVSWSENESGKGDTSVNNHLESDNPDKECESPEGRKTPLMYRAEKTHETIANEDSNSVESDVEENPADPEKQKKTNTNDDRLSSHSTSSPKTAQHQKKRPKSAGFLKRLAEKSNGSPTRKPQLKTLTLTQSLCDLRQYDELSCDELVMMNSEMASQRFLPLSPGSKSSSSDDVRTPTGSATKRRIKDPITVAMALAYKLTDNEWLWERVYTKQVELNTREGAWLSLEQEVDAHLLSCLMWSWIEHLSEPVLTKDAVEKLVSDYSQDLEKTFAETECPDPALFKKALSSLGKPISLTLLCILDCLLSLPPLSLDLELSVIKRVTSAFMQSAMLDEQQDSEEGSESRKTIEQLVSLIHNYIVKTRAKTMKKQSSVEEKENKDDEQTKIKDSAISDQNSEPKVTNVVKTEFARGEGDSTPSTSKVSELPPRIAVS